MRSFLLIFALFTIPVLADDSIPVWAGSIPQLKAEGGWVNYDTFHVADVGSFYISVKKSIFVFEGVDISPYEGTKRFGMGFCQGLITSTSVSNNGSKIEFKGKEDLDPRSSDFKFTFQGYIEKIKDGYKFSVIIDKGENGLGKKTIEFYRTLKDKRAIKISENIPLDFGQ